MVTVLALIGVVAVLFVAAVVSTREGPVLADAPPDVADLQLPDRPLAPADVQGLRFGLAARGYRMSEVDQALERLSVELADRDRRIALLEGTVEGADVPAAGSVREASPADLPVPEPVGAAVAAPEPVEPVQPSQDAFPPPPEHATAQPVTGPADALDPGTATGRVNPSDTADATSTPRAPALAPPEEPFQPPRS